MASLIEELENFRVYNKDIYLPVEDSDRKHGSVMFLLTPNLSSSKDFLQSIRRKDDELVGFVNRFKGEINWDSYYMEKDVSYYMNQESFQMSRIISDLILEDGEFTLKTKEKNSLSNFKRVDINESTVEEHIMESDQMGGIVEYFPWTGYLYLNESDKLVAGINVNIEDKEIQKIFVVDEKYSYLYKDLIQEARNLKANYITLNKNQTGAIQALKEFGFSEIETYEDSIKMQFKVPISEAANMTKELESYIENDQKYSNPSIIEDRMYKALKNAVSFYRKKFHLNEKVCALMCRIMYSYDGHEICLSDLKLLKYMTMEEIKVAHKAATFVFHHDKGSVPDDLYTRILIDCTDLIHYTDIDVIIQDEVLRYYADNAIHHRYDNMFLYMDEVEPIVANIERKHSKGSIGNFILKYSYEYYRKAHKKVQKAISKGLTNKICIDYRVSVREAAEGDLAAKLLTESHVAFGYKDESFSFENSIWDEQRKTIKPENGFYNESLVPADKGIVIQEGSEIKIALRVNEENSITEIGLFEPNIDPSFPFAVASRKFGANKVAIPENCTDMIEAVESLAEWTHVLDDNGYCHYDKLTSAYDIPYPDKGIDEECVKIFNRLNESDQNYMGRQFSNKSCISNTIYSKAYNEGFVDVYVLPQFPNIGWIDVAVLEKHRHKGHAFRMINETIAEMKKNYPKIDALGWCCNVNNQASYNLALKSGFIPHKLSNERNDLFMNLNSNELIPNTFTESADYTDDINWNGRDLPLDEVSIHRGNYYYLIDEDVSKAMDNKTYSRKFRNIMWEDRIKNNKQVLEIYEDVKKTCMIKHAYLDLKLYKKKNLFVDLSFYNIDFFNNYTKAGANAKAITEMYFEIMSRLIKDKRFMENYSKITVYVPVDDWCKENLKKDDKSSSTTRKLDYVENLNPLSTLLYYAYYNPIRLKEEFLFIDFIFISESGNFVKARFNDYTKTDFVKFKTSLEKLLKKVYVEYDKKYSKKAIVHSVLDRIEASPNGVQINSIITSKEDDRYIHTNNMDVEKNIVDDEAKKRTVVRNIEKIAAETNSPEDAMIDMEKKAHEDEYTARLLNDLANNQSGNVNISAARSKRLNQLSESFLRSKISDAKLGFNGTMEEYMKINAYDGELDEKPIPIESINEDWKHIRFTNFDERYSVRADIYAILYSFATKSARLVIKDTIDIKDTSTSEDWKETWTVPFEDQFGKRFKIKFDIPLLKDNRNMVLGGNDKNMSGQLVLIPISKTDDDTAQIVTFYNKIFIRRFAMGGCKSNRDADRLSKFVESYSKEHPNSLKISYGDSSITSNKYDLPFDYVDLGCTYYGFKIYKSGKLTGEVFFNQDNARKEAGLKDNDPRMPIGYVIRKDNKKDFIYFNDYTGATCAMQIFYIIAQTLDCHNEFYDIKPAARHCYSKASILGTEIPIIVIMAYSEGLTEALRKGHVDYIISEKRVNSYNMDNDVIKFKDAYLYYRDDYNSSMLMNGLKELDTKNYSIQEIDNKSMWTDFLDEFGGRIKSDGLDNFYDLAMDPITIEICQYYKLPTDYCELLAYANLMLCTNEYTKHTDLGTDRYRTNEMIAVHAYKALSKSYANYKAQLKRERTGVTMTIKQSAIIDSIMEESIMSDFSFMNPNQEAEARNSVGFKGLTGMNNDRSYSLDKRTYDPTMINKIAMSTGFAGNVGVNRQTTIDMQVKGVRGYIKNSDVNDGSVTKTLSITEALTPFGSTRDDPFRTAMTNIQTSKHNMRIKNSTPLLVTSGADQALPYLTGDSFAFKAKASGKVIKMTKDYMIVEYDYTPVNGVGRGNNRLIKASKAREMIDLRENVRKNSDGGFYITIKLDTNLKKGSRFKANDILAYDKVVYSDQVGDGKHIAYSIGALANVAYLNTDEGFEDSAIISHRLSDALTSEVTVQISKNLPANTNIFSIAKKGDKVQEGDTLLLYQSPFEEEDANRIVKNLSMDSKEVSELGRVPIKSKVTGIVQDVRLYRTVDYSEMSSSMKKIFKEYEDNIEVMRKDSEGTLNKVPLEANYKLPAVSKMKNCEGKVKIEFYIKYNDKMGIGDKLVFYSAVKGETKIMFPKNKEPYTDRVKSEQIDTLCPLPSINHRMVASVKIITGLYKGVIELTRYMKEACGIKYIPYNPREGYNDKK